MTTNSVVPLGQPTTAIALRGAGKRYRLYSKPLYRLLDLFGACPATPRYYSEHLAVKDVDLEIGRGEKVAIIGRNGAGKSTLLKLITGLVQPTSGIDRGQRPGQQPAANRIRISSRLHRAAERVREPRAPGYRREGSGAPVRRDPGLRGNRGVRRSADEDLLDGHVLAADVRLVYRDQTGNPDRRRNSRRRRRLLRAQELRADAEDLFAGRHNAAARHARYLFGAEFVRPLHLDRSRRSQVRRRRQVGGGAIRELRQGTGRTGAAAEEHCGDCLRRTHRPDPRAVSEPLRIRPRGAARS